MRQEERRYPVLSTMSLVLKILAVLVLAVGFIGAITTPGITGGGVIVAVLTAAFIAIVLYALADVILVIIDIEHNTYMTRQELVSRMTPPTQPIPGGRVEGEERRRDELIQELRELLMPGGRAEEGEKRRAA